MKTVPRLSKMPLFRSCLLVAALQVAAVASSSAVYITSFSFDSAPGSWVGQGRSVDASADTGYLFRTQLSNPNYFGMSIFTSNSPFGPDWDPGSGDAYDYWELQMKAPGTSPLAPGLYENTARFPFQAPDQPGLTVYGNHRGNNTNGGFFEILDIGFDSSGEIAMLNATFTQYGEQQESRWLTGSVKYNFDPDPDTPGGGEHVPSSGSTVAFLVLGLVALRGFAGVSSRNKRRA